MSEDEEKPKQKENKSRLVTREEFLEQSRALVKTSKIADQALKIQMGGIIQAASDYSRLMEQAQRLGTLLASHQSPMIKGLLEASKNMDRVIEEARKRARMIAQVDILAGTGAKPSDVNPSLLLGFSRDLENVEEAIEAIPEDVAEKLPELNQVDKQELLNQIAALREKVEKLEQANQPKSIKRTKKRGANLDTREKIRRLASIREDEIQKHKLPRGWIVACQYVGIDPKTARSHAPVLRAKWNDITFRWSEDQEHWEN